MISKGQRQAVKNAIANIKLEGLEPSYALKRDLYRVVSGKLTIEQAIGKVKKRLNLA